MSLLGTRTWALGAPYSSLHALTFCKKRKLSENISHIESIVQQQQEQIKELEALNSQLVKRNAELDAELKAMKQRQAGGIVAMDAGQAGEPTGVCITPDMKYLITAVDKMANVWQVDSGEFVKGLPHQGSVRCICMAPDGGHFFSVEDGGFGRKFSIPGFEQECLFDGKDEQGLYACCLLGDGKRFIAASDCGSVKMFDAELGGGPLLCLEGPGRVSSVVTSPTSPLIFCGRDDAGRGIVQAFSTETGKLQRTFRGSGRGVSAMWVTPDGRWLLTASWDKTAKVWDISTGTVFLAFCAREPCVAGHF